MYITTDIICVYNCIYIQVYIYVCVYMGPIFLSTYLRIEVLVASGQYTYCDDILLLFVRVVGKTYCKILEKNGKMSSLCNIANRIKQLRMLDLWTAEVTSLTLIIGQIYSIPREMFSC